MYRQTLEVADIFRDQGAHWRQVHQGHISLDQYRVMNAIERCRSATLGGHVLQCTDCGYQQIAYNSCRNRHCPKCQGSAAHRWLEARQVDLLPVEYYHLVFTLPAPISDLAYSNKSVMHHPHVHGIVPGGGLSMNGEQWVQPLKKIDWVVYAKRPFAGPKAVLAYLSRYTHRIAISNSRLLRFDEQGVTFKWKDYRCKKHQRYKTMILDTDEFIRHFHLSRLPQSDGDYRRLCAHSASSSTSEEIEWMSNIPFNKLTRYWQQSVRLCFGRAAQSSGFMVLYAHNIEVTESMIDYFDLIAALVWLAVLTSTDSGHLKNPIDISSPEASRLRPAVSSLDACPTSAL